MKPRLAEKLLQLEKNLLNPSFCKDIENLNSCLASDFTEYGQSGTIYGRDEVIRVLLSASDDRADTEIEDFTIRCLGSHAAVVHYTAVRKGGMEKRSLRTSVWVKEEGEWKLHFHQGTEKKG